MFRAIAGHDENATSRSMYRRDLTSEEKRIARHMAHKDATTHEIAQALKWELGEHTLWEKLKAINIKPKHTYNNSLRRK